MFLKLCNWEVQKPRVETSCPFLLNPDIILLLPHIIEVGTDPVTESYTSFLKSTSCGHMPSNILKQESSNPKGKAFHL